METAEQTEALQILLDILSNIANGILRTMADVCKAFCIFRVFSGLVMNIRVHSCPFVVPYPSHSCIFFTKCGKAISGSSISGCHFFSHSKEK